jgi:hypothetical protein
MKRASACHGIRLPALVLMLGFQIQVQVSSSGILGVVRN